MVSAAAIDLDAYKERVGYHGPLIPSLEVLCALHRCQMYAIPFENLDIHFGREICLDSASLFKKLIGAQRGGYCYELNGLLALVLIQIGFSVKFLAGRSIFGVLHPRPRSHQILLVELNGKSWLVDTGFGGNGPIEPLPFILDQETTNVHDRFRITQKREHLFTLEMEMSLQWHALYEFSLDEQHPIDYQMMNYYNSTCSSSWFTQQRICSRPTPEARIQCLIVHSRYVPMMA